MLHVRIRRLPAAAAAPGGQDNAGYLGTVDAKLVPHPLSQDDRAALLDFLRSLDGTYRGDPKQAPNWWRWPDR
jgi:hypothetical protein